MENGAGWITRKTLLALVREAGRRNAPVLRIDDFTKGDKFRALVFTVLSARTKDETTLAVCRRLFSKIRGPRDFAAMEESEMKKLIYGVGFYNTKARNIIGLSKMLVSGFGGKVPDDFDSLMKLPGVGRKTANVVLAHAFGKDAIGVDVHVQRISNRLGIVRTEKPEDTEQRLKKAVPKNLWSLVNLALVSHGQTTCLPRVPFCSRCIIRKHCRRIGVKKWK